MGRVSTIERAYQLARDGPCTSLTDIRRQLKREKHEAVDQHLSGRSLARDLISLYIGVELQSLASYVLAAWRRDAGREGGVVNASTAVYEEGSGDVGAIIMGRNMFGGGPGPWATRPGRAGGARSRRSTCPSTSSHTISGRRSNAAEARRSRS